jgi:malate dehydrogenase
MSIDCDIFFHVYLIVSIDQNRAQARIAARLHISPDAVNNVIIWGNHSSTQFPDVCSATVIINGKQMSVFDAIQDDSWLRNQLTTVG